jgi:hypothetical protein
LRKEKGLGRGRGRGRGKGGRRKGGKNVAKNKLIEKNPIEYGNDKGKRKEKKK